SLSQILLVIRSGHSSIVSFGTFLPSSSNKQSDKINGTTKDVPFVPTTSPFLMMLAWRRVSRYLIPVLREASRRVYFFPSIVTGISCRWRVLKLSSADMVPLLGAAA